MTPADTLALLEGEIRAAVAAGDFDGARSTWDRYAACLRRLPATEPNLAPYLEDARRLVEWTSKTCAAVKAQAQEELCQMAGAARYADSGAPRRHLFRLSG